MLGRAACSEADREVVAYKVPDAALLGASLGQSSVELDSEATWIPRPLWAATMHSRVRTSCTVLRAGSRSLKTIETKRLCAEHMRFCALRKQESKSPQEQGFQG